MAPGFDGARLQSARGPGVGVVGAGLDPSQETWLCLVLGEHLGEHVRKGASQTLPWGLEGSSPPSAQCHFLTALVPQLADAWEGSCFNLASGAQVRLQCQLGPAAAAGEGGRRAWGLGLCHPVCCPPVWTSEGSGMTGGRTLGHQITCQV